MRSREELRRLLILKDVRKDWEQLQREAQPPDCVYIREHDAGDLENGECRGEVVRAWVLDEQGCRETADALEAFTPGERRGHYWQRGLVTFHVWDAEDRGLIVKVYGPLWGGGTITRFIRYPTTMRMVIEEHVWVS